MEHEKNILEQKIEPDLMNDSLFIEFDGRLHLVGLDASDVEGLLGGQRLHQRVHRVLEDRSGCQRTFRRLRDVVSALRPHRPEKVFVLFVNF
jgi:hypothetical protein